MELETDEGTFGITTAAELRGQLSRLDTRNNRAILSTGDEHYIQTSAYDNGFVIEKREGSEEAHFHARYRGERETLPSPPTPGRKLSWWKRLFGLSHRPWVAQHAFTRPEMMEILEAYLVGAPDPEFIESVIGYGN